MGLFSYAYQFPCFHHIFVRKKSFFKVNFFKLITWYPNMVQIEMRWVNIPSTFIKIKNHLSCFWNIFVFLNMQVHYICFHKHTPISNFIK
jgi:hypothetical protein